MSVLDWNGLSYYDSKLKAKITEWLNGKANKVHTHTKSEVGLDKVDNTTDADKPISTSQKKKFDEIDTTVAGKSPIGHKHTKSDITDFPTLGTASKKDVSPNGNASTSQVVMGNDTRLTDARKASDVSAWAKALTKPTYTANEVGLGNVGNFKAVSTVASQELTDVEKSNARSNINAQVAGSYASSSHNHDDRYYTELEIDTKLNGKANSSHTHGNADITSLDASKITSGTISIDRLPQGALERLTIVADDTARFKLTSSNVQKGDTVKVTATGKMYYVVDETKLSSEAGYEVYAAGTAASVPWSGVTGKPSSYTPSSHTHDDRYYTESEINTKLAGKSDTGHTHSQYLTAHQDISGKVNNDANGADSLLSKITTSWTAIPTDDTNFIRQDIGGGNTFGRVKFSTLWSYIKGKADSVYSALGHKHTKSEITDFPTSMAANGGNSSTVNGHTVNSDVPSGAKFTDTNTWRPQPDWNATSGDAVIKNKPTIPSVGNGTITIKQAGTVKGTFTTNQSGATTIELTDNNTTYSTGTTSTSGITKLYTGTGSATDGSMTQSAITTALNGKAASSHSHNTATWTAKTDNRNYQVAYSLNNQYNFDNSNSFQYNPSTKTLKAGNNVTIGSATLQYNSTNNCIDFVFS